MHPVAGARPGRSGVAGQVRLRQRVHPVRDRVVAGTSPPASVIVVPVVGVALSTKSFSTALPPSLFTTVLFSASVGATSLFVIAQLPTAPSSSVTVLPV